MANAKRVFLSAGWKNLLLLNYSVEDSLLVPYLPPSCELDRYQGKAFVSLVAFQFLNTKVFGARWPGFTNFPEINLRFYVRYKEKRGVVFFREYVPSRLIAAIARGLYNEPYYRAKMETQIHLENDEPKARYFLQYQGASLELAARLARESVLPPEDSLEHFFKEHDLGVGRDRQNKIVTYEVSHPIWRTRKVLSQDIQIDWTGLYGSAWNSLNGKTPDSVVFAEGSDIQVFYPD